MAEDPLDRAVELPVDDPMPRRANRVRTVLLVFAPVVAIGLLVASLVAVAGATDDRDDAERERDETREALEEARVDVEGVKERLGYVQASAERGSDDTERAVSIGREMEPIVADLVELDTSIAVRQRELIELHRAADFSAYNETVDELNELGDRSDDAADRLDALIDTLP